MKRIKKSTWVTLALLIYVTATAIYLVPRNTEISGTEKALTVIASYIIVFTLWIVLKQKEKVQERRREEDEQLRQQKNQQQSDK